MAFDDQNDHPVFSMTGSWEVDFFFERRLDDIRFGNFPNAYGLKKPDIKQTSFIRWRIEKYHTVY